VRSVFNRVRQERLPVSRHVVRVTPFQKVFFPDENELEESLQSLVQSFFGIPTMKKADDTPVETESKKRKLSCENDDMINVSNATVDILGDNTANEKIESLIPENVQVVNESIDEEVILNSTIEATNSCIPLSNITEVSKDIIPRRKFVYTIQFKARNHNVLVRSAVHSVVMRNMPSFSRPDKSDFEGVVLVEALKNICGMSIITGMEDMCNLNLRKFQIEMQETKKED